MMLRRWVRRLNSDEVQSGTQPFTVGRRRSKWDADVQSGTQPFGVGLRRSECEANVPSVATCFEVSRSVRTFHRPCQDLGQEDLIDSSVDSVGAIMARLKIWEAMPRRIRPGPMCLR